MTYGIHTDIAHQDKDLLLITPGVLLRLFEGLKCTLEIPLISLDQTGAGVGPRITRIQSQGKFEFAPRIGKFFLVEQPDTGKGVMLRGIELAQGLLRLRPAGYHEDAYGHQQQEPK